MQLAVDYADSFKHILPPPTPPTGPEDRFEQQRERERQLMERFEMLKTRLPSRIRAPPEVAPRLPNLKKPTPIPTKA